MDSYILIGQIAPYVCDTVSTYLEYFISHFY